MIPKNVLEGDSKNYKMKLNEWFNRGRV